MPTKTGGFDESVPFNLKSHSWFLPVLEKLKAGKTDEEPLWSQSQAQLAELLRDSANALGMGHMLVVPYSFRHGGASRDIVSGERDLFTVKKILRHLSDLTVRRYERPARLRSRSTKCRGRPDSMASPSRTPWARSSSSRAPVQGRR